MDEPREEKSKTGQLKLLSTDDRGRQLKGWTNKLIWGDNKLALSSLINGPLREEIERKGGLKLIHALLAEDGSIYVHCDRRVDAYLRLILDDVFEKDNFKNEVIWCYKERERVLNTYNPKHDMLLFYSKSNSIDRPFNWQEATEEYSEVTKKKFKYKDDKGWYQIRGKNTMGSPIQAADGLTPEDEQNYPGLTYRDYIENRAGVAPRDWWNIDIINKAADERTAYITQKPEALLERIVKVSSNDGDLVADFFCGSGTTPAVAEKLGRKWIACDLGRFAIHTTRKRLIQVQRELKRDDKPYRAFEVLNLGKYERKYFMGINLDLTEDEQRRQLELKHEAYINLILEGYKAKRVEGLRTLCGVKAQRFVHVGPLDFPITRKTVEEIYDECREKVITQVDVLGFEFEMGLLPRIEDEMKDKGINLKLKYIPREVFDKRAVKKGQVKFYDGAYLEVKPEVKGKKVKVRLKDFTT
ncbi:MAG: adenine specific DNA methylase [Candidatus Brocadia sinica]|nr:MAG: adenine specific DNA methylase [Candidatus Brocadia sinica]